MLVASVASLMLFVEDQIDMSFMDLQQVVISSQQAAYIDIYWK